MELNQVFIFQNKKQKLNVILAIKFILKMKLNEIKGYICIAQCSIM